MKPLGPHRLAALAEQRPGHCSQCDEALPHPGPFRGPKYTCRKEECRRAWVQLIYRDAREELRLAREALDRAEGAIG